MHSIVGRVRSHYAKGGISGLLRGIGRWAWYWCAAAPARAALFYWHRAFRRPRFPTFRFRSIDFHYAYHRYNSTWASERIVEIPIAKKFLEDAVGKRTLEVGNVLAHYGVYAHDVLDKYERGQGVINKDVVEFHPAGNYDRILAVSTLEHVGWDSYERREPEKVLQAVKNLIACLAPGGIMLITMPIGYNSSVDQFLEEKKFPFTEAYFLKRISRANEWQEATYDEVRGAPYNSPYFAANAIVVGVVEKN